MPQDIIQLLVVEDSEDDFLLVLHALKQGGLNCRATRVEDAGTFRNALVEKAWDLILCDYSLPSFTAPEALEILKSIGTDIPFLVISGGIGEEAIIQLMKSGARDFILKDHLRRLPGAIGRELEEAEARRQLKRVEEQFRQAQKMEAIGRLAGGVAHDFNNLLTIITGFAQLALIEPNPAQSGLEQILRASERAASLTRQLLIFSRQQALEVRVFNLNTLLRDLEKMIRRVIGEDVEVRTIFHEQEPLVKADPNQMEQVILNLVVNSRDAMPGGGILTIETKYCDVDPHAADIHGCAPGHYFQLDVNDTGVGIDKKTLPQIFEPFFTTKAEGRGTGLGLSTVYGIVRQTGGAILASSQPGVGTTMSILLPAATEGLPASSVTQEVLIPRGTETVLVVEDDQTVLTLCSTILQTNGYTVLEADDVNDAVKIAREHREKIHLLVSDVVMPGKNGPSLAVEIRDARPEIRTLFMSGYTEETMNQHGFSSNSAGFIQKPFSASSFARKVRQVLDAKAGSAFSSVS